MNLTILLKHLMIGIKLLEIKWWNWYLEKIHENRDLLTKQNIDKFIEKFV